MGKVMPVKKGIRDSSTRREILDLLRKEEMDIKELSGRLGISPTGVRQHLMILQNESLVQSKPVRIATGRPRHVYSLSEKANEHFPKAYDVFLEWVIREIVETEGEHRVKELFEEIARKRAREMEPHFQEKEPAKRVQSLVELLNREGRYAEYEENEEGYLIREYHCPIRKIADRYSPLVCSYEEVLFQSLLGGKVQQIQRMGEGSRFCSFRVRGGGMTQFNNEKLR
jgi:predicted ArsR family transcriptional regulator